MDRFFQVRNLARMALLIACTVVLARYVGIQLSDSLRISFECVPILLAGIWLGPVAGALVGALADVIGMLLAPSGPYFPILTLTPALLGALAGLCALAIRRERLNLWRTALLVVGCDLLVNLLWGSFAVQLYLLVIVGKNVPYWTVLAGRLAPKAVLAVLDAAITAPLYLALERALQHPKRQKGGLA